MKIVWSTWAIESLIAHFDIWESFYAERFSDTGLWISTETVIIEQYTALSRARRDEMYGGVIMKLSQEPLIWYEKIWEIYTIASKVGNYRVKIVFYKEEGDIHIQELTIWRK